MDRIKNNCDGSERRLWNKTTTEVRFYLSSLDSNAEKIALAIRSHWGMKNSLHWTLYVTFSLRQESDSQRSFSRKFCFATSRVVSIYRNEKKRLKEV